MTESDGPMSLPEAGPEYCAPDPPERQFALKYYEIMLGALADRERQVVQMFAYVAPSLAALAWMVVAGDSAVVFGGTCILAVILAHGRQHIVRMAYNFRCCMRQTGKIEKVAKWEHYILEQWKNRTDEPPRRDDFLPEMFRSQVDILRFAMWSVIIVGSVVVLGHIARCFFLRMFEGTPWPSSALDWASQILSGLALLGMLALGCVLDRRSGKTVGEMTKKLEKVYELENGEGSVERS